MFHLYGNDPSDFFERTMFPAVLASFDSLCSLSWISPCWSVHNNGPSILTWSTLSATAKPQRPQFGTRQYWETTYTDAAPSSSFSWYSTWSDLEPFVQELLPNKDATTANATRILLPGVGNDPLLGDLYRAGFTRLDAFDYSAAGVACAERLLLQVQNETASSADDNDGTRRNHTVRIVEADARNLSAVYPGNEAFGLILDKGTLDCIYIAGGTHTGTENEHRGNEYLDQALAEFARLTEPGGVIVSVTAACVDAVMAAFQRVLGTSSDEWEELRNGDFYITEDGYTSNNIDGTLLAWRRKTKNGPFAE